MWRDGLRRPVCSQAIWGESCSPGLPVLGTGHPHPGNLLHPSAPVWLREVGVSELDHFPRPLSSSLTPRTPQLWVLQAAFRRRTGVCMSSRSTELCLSYGPRAHAGKRPQRGLAHRGRSPHTLTTELGDPMGSRLLDGNPRGKTRIQDVCRDEGLQIHRRDRKQMSQCCFRSFCRESNGLK